MRAADFRRELYPHPAFGRAGGLARGLAASHQRRSPDLSQATNGVRCHSGQLDVGSLQYTKEIAEMPSQYSPLMVPSRLCTKTSGETGARHPSAEGP
jgi:hypothetical protein